MERDENRKNKVIIDVMVLCHPERRALPEVEGSSEVFLLQKRLGV